MKTSLTIGTLLLTTALATPAFAQVAPPSSSTPQGTTAVQELPTQPPAEIPPEDTPEISVPGGADASDEPEEIVVRGRFIPEPIRNTPEIVAVLSAADIARTGDGNIAGALQRVTGLSVVGNGFVYVRGLGDRYSLALLNGLPLPSPEPLRRVVPLDIFPTSVLGSALVQKSYSANYPGEFGGGVINLTTRAIPTESFLTIGAGISGDTETTFELGYTHYGSDTDWLGYDDGARDPRGAFARALGSGNLITEGQDFTRRDIQDIAASLTNSATSVAQVNRNIPVNWAADFSGGASLDTGFGRIGLLAAGGISNSWRTRDAIQQVSGGFAGDVLNPDIDFRSVRTDNRVIVNGLLQLGAEIGDHRLRFTNLYIHDTLKQTRLARGIDDLSVGSDTEIITQNTNWFERQLFDTQGVAELRFGDFGIDLRGTYANTKRDAPYERSFSYAFDRTAGDFVNNLTGAGQSARIAFSELDEDVYGAGIDLSYKIVGPVDIRLVGGYAYTDTQRSSIRREFRFVPFAPLNLAVAQQRPDFLLSDFNIYTYNILLTETSGQAGTAAFDAGLRVHAGYAQVEAEFGGGLSATAGVRYEDGRQFVQPLDLFGTGAGSDPTRINNDYWLPAATVTWNFRDDMQLRVNASKTIARPQFRELAFQLYQDTETDRQFFGNPFLVDSELFNAEARYEWYFARAQRVTLSGFYKKIDRPIEAFAFRSSSTLQTSFANAPEADLYGGEIEVVKYVPLSGLGDGDFFGQRRLILIGNYTYTKSKIRVGAGDQVVFSSGQVFDATDFFRDGSPLTGQSEHIANLQIGLENTERVSQQTLLLTYASERVTNRGPFGTPQQPDIMEKPGIRLDLVLREEVPIAGQTVGLKFEVRNITGQRYAEFQEAGSSRIDVNTFDVGTSIAFGAEIKF